jgi:hypothetical protein
MKLRPALMILMLLGLVATPAWAAEYTAESTKDSPPADQFSSQVLAQIGSAGIKINKGKRILLEIWPARQWTIKPDFTPTNEVLYPFEPGQLVAVVQYKSKGGDFRGQEIKPGFYTVRYGQQPVDGNHVGTAPTRDFFLLLPAADDQSPDPLEKEKLFEESAAAAESSHPAILYLKPAPQEAAEPSIEETEGQEWWAVTFKAPAKANGQPVELPVSLVVVGQGQE